jgi:hypothetical protein
MAMKAVFAGGDDRRLKLQNRFVSQARGIRKIAGSASDGGDQALVRVQQQRDLMGQGGHG